MPVLKSGVSENRGNLCGGSLLLGYKRGTHILRNTQMGSQDYPGGKDNFTVRRLVTGTMAQSTCSNGTEGKTVWRV